MQIFVQLPNGKTITVDISLDQTIKDLKAKIKERYAAIPVDLQMLTFENNLCEDSNKLLSYGIKAEKKLVLSSYKLEFEKQEKTIGNVEYFYKW